MRRLLSLLLVLMLAGCHLPPLMSSPHAAVGAASVQALGASAIQGSIKLARRTQATLGDIADGATVSLIDGGTGLTLATTVSDPSGNFTLSFKNFNPVSGQAYFLEAIKGIKGTNPSFNEAGADAVRLRTILYFQNGGWVSLTNSTPGPVTISKGTTTMCVAIALKRQAGQTLNLSDYIGALVPSPYVTVGAITDTTYNQLYPLVSDAIDQDRDPIQYVAYDASKGTFTSSWVGFSITSVTPTQGYINDTITITGTGFNVGTATVAVNGTPATLVSTASDTLVAQIAPGTRTGPVSVQIGASVQAGQTFTVLTNDGHRSISNGTLYATNPGWGTLVSIASNGDTTTLLTGLSNPSQVVVGPDQMLYVSCRGANKVIKVDPSNPGAYTTFGPAITSPYGLAFDATGSLYVTSYQTGPSGTIVELNASGTQVATFTGFDRPRGVAFDYAGNLFVSEESGNVTKLTPAGSNGNPRTLWAVVPSPLGLALDSAGNLYVASNTNNVVYRIDTSRNATVFKVLNQPGGITFDTAGYLYVSDTGNNLINRVSPLGDVKIYAYGISNPRGLAIDPSTGGLFVSLSQSNAILKYEGGALKQFVTGIANPQTLTFRNNGLYIAHQGTGTLSYANRQGQLSTLLTGLTQPGGVDAASDGTLYIGSTFDSTRGGVKVLSPAGSLSTIYSNLRRSDDYLAADGSSHVFSVSSSDKILNMTTLLGNKLVTTQTLYTFANAPGAIAYDSSGNVYVVVPAENAVYRFTKASSYAATTITGFNNPIGLAFSDTGVLYVSNKGDGNLRRVSSPASAGTADAWTSGAFQTYAASKSVEGLGFYNGKVYMANGTSVDAYSIAGDSVSNYVSSIPNAVHTLAVGPAGDLYGYSNGAYEYKISTSQVVTSFLDLTGYAIMLSFAMDPSGNYYQGLMYQYAGGLEGPNFSAPLGYLNNCNEVALDTDRLYIACQQSGGYKPGGIFRMDVSTGQQYFYRGAGQVFSLAVDGSRNLYAGSDDGKVYYVNASTGATTMTWNLGAIAYGLDMNGTTVWAVGADGRIFELLVGGGIITHYYGLMAPTF